MSEDKKRQAVLAKDIADTMLRHESEIAALRECVQAADARIETLRRLAFDRDMDCLSMKAELYDRERDEEAAYDAARARVKL